EKDVVAAKYQPKQGEPSAIAGKRIIYVTLPAGKNNPARETSPRERVASPGERETSPRERVASPGERETSPIENVKSPVVFPDRSVASYPSPVFPDVSEEKSARTPEDRNDGVELMPRASRRRIRTNILQSAAVVLCVIALLA